MLIPDQAFYPITAPGSGVLTALAARSYNFRVLGRHIAGVGWIQLGLYLGYSLIALAPASAEPPHVPVEELPPLPEIVEETAASEVAVIGATEADEDVVVAASKREQSLGSVASAVTVITADRLRRWGYRTIAEALRSVVGLYIADDRAIERIGIRGVALLGDANTRVLILIDGSPVNEPWSQSVDTSHALPVHLDEVARIEVIRGPVSSIYGTNAFFGIINIVTLAADKAPRAYARIGASSYSALSANAGFAAGDVNHQVRGFVAVLGRDGETLEYPAYAEVAPDFDPRTSADGITAAAAGVVVHYDRLFLQVRGHTRTRELPGAPYGSRFGSTDNRNRDRLVFGEAGYTRDVTPELSVSARVYADRYQYRGDLSFEPQPPFRTIGDATWAGAEVRGLLDLTRLAGGLPGRGHLDLTAGLTADQTLTESRSFDPGIPGGDQQAVRIVQDFAAQGVYGELNGRWPLPRGSSAAFTVGLRYDRNSEFDDNLSPRGALFFDHRGLYGIKLLAAEGFRNPSVFEAYFEDNRRFRPTCSPQCGDIGTTLSSELISSREVVLWGKPTPGANLRVSAWQWRLEKLIEKSEVFDPRLLEEVVQFGNVFVDYTSRGVEVEASYRDTRGWLGFGSAAVAAVRRGGAPAAGSAALTAKVGVSTPRLGEQVHVSTEVELIGARPTRDPALDAERHLGWNLVLYAPSLRGIDVTVGVRNLLGTREQVPVQADYDRADSPVPILLIPGAGREIFGRMGYVF